MPRKVAQRIEDILEHIHHIQDNTIGIDRDTFQSDSLRYDAVSWNFRVIGEAISHLPTSLKTEHPTIPWITLIELSTHLSHAYYDVPHPLVWSIATQDLSSLIPPLEKILSDLKSPPIELA